jgi:predicted homoserine dehydrogenase-like protein
MRCPTSSRCSSRLSRHVDQIRCLLYEVGRKLRRSVAKGEFITADAVGPPADSSLCRLRAEQDALFWGCD